ncbi:MAG: NADH-quinone oxidoreductase subunit L [Candidatus Latescibacterota bacterium]|nr:MAG: NADH-quinone oxidoreductase subunit L [Candidatus Latescibacterota bacterium]
MENYLWLIPVAPLAGAFINGMLAISFSRSERSVSEPLVSFIGCVAPLISFATAVAVFFHLRDLPASERVLMQTVFPWIVSGELHVDFALMVDTLSMVMILVVTGVGTIIHFYSIGYMHKDDGYARFFAYLNLFTFAMLTLVMAKSLPVMFVGWEGVGLCSYLLIGFWYKDMANAAAGKKAFVVNRIGDFAFLIGMFLLYTVTVHLDHPSLDFPVIRELVSNHGDAFAATATIIGILLFIGATGKSAQIPLYVWLPDAMAGPTPVSALIHAATMVTAGVYMVARLSYVYLESPVAMMIVATVGAVTAIFAATIGICQKDIKKVLAYSTVSQLGYMFAAVGVGAYAAGVFHLMTHAFFKACLFLGAGSVIHGMSGEQNIFKMGALGKKMKTTMVTFVIAAVTIAGLPPLAAFFSKDEILWYTFTADVGPVWLPKLLWALLFVGAGITAFYMFRAVFVTFFGQRRYSDEAAHHLHESPKVMTWPLIILAAGSIVAGFVGVPEILGGSNWFHHYLEPSIGPVAHHAAEAAGHGAETAVHGNDAAGHAAEAAGHGAAVGHGGADHGGHSKTLEFVLMALSVLVGLTGILIAYRLYLKQPMIPEQLAARARGLYNLVYNKYFVDEAYEKTIVKPGYEVSDKLFFRVVDVWIIDAIVNGVGVFARLFGSVVRLFQTGLVRTYALFFLLGLIYLIYKLVG